MKIKAFLTHKLSEDYSSCQDFFTINSESRAICLSDGMSQSIFPDYWARIVSQHVADTFEFSEESRITKLCPLWKEKVQEYIDKEKSEGRNPWRLESNLDEGISAGCTICAIKFLSTTEWQGMVLGDSCIVVVHWDLNSIEIISSEEKEFDSYPDFVDSNPCNKGKGKIKELHGELNKDTTLLLVSDPFSEYLSSNSDGAMSFVKELIDIQNHGDFDALVARWRQRGMHNDDTSLVVINYDDNNTFNVEIADNLDDFIKSELEPNMIDESQIQNQTIHIEFTTDNAPLEKLLTKDADVQDEDNKPLSIKKEDEIQNVEIGKETSEDENLNIIPNCGSGSGIDIQYLKDNSEDVVERFLCSNKARSIKELWEWIFGWRQHVKTTLMKYNEFIQTIEMTDENDTNTDS